MDSTVILFPLVLLLSIPMPSLAIIKSNITDQHALLALKSHIKLIPNSNSSFLLSNWTTETSVCSWIGIKCWSRHNRVVALDFLYLGLQGTIPPQVGNLSFLRDFELTGNNFHGKLPEEIVHLRRLEYFSVAFNSFSGEVPSWVGSLPKLQYLYLENNSFTGSLPSSLVNATNLKVLILTFNQLEGEIPQEIGNLGNLVILDMQANQLTGPLPLSIFNISSLHTIAFTYNGLSGSLPERICSKLPNLKDVYLEQNRLSGQTQSTFDNCSVLQLLSLSDNKFSGSLPRDIGNLTAMTFIALDSNSLGGENPPEFGNLVNLDSLIITDNFLYGPIPEELGNLQKLTVLESAYNALSGPIPASIFNISSLSVISLGMNKLSGTLPPYLAKQLEGLFLGHNYLSGAVLGSISNLTNLVKLDLGTNQFSGSIPSSLANLGFLAYLHIDQNLFTSDTEFAFLASLTNCTSLSELDISEIPLHGTLPPAIGNFSSTLQMLYANDCGIEGNIPSEIGNLIGLSVLILSNNSLTGPLPMAFQRLSNLQELNVEGNNITGFIPSYICQFRHIVKFYLNENQFVGQIPECFGNITSLRYLYLHFNGLNSTLPATLWSLGDLLYLDIHSNSLSGYIKPEIGNLKSALYIDLSENEFSGNIPTTMGGQQNLFWLSLANNQLKGAIPQTFGKMLSLESLDLSRNNLTGEVPMSLEFLFQLKYFNVSFNHLRGKIPENGSFLNFTNESFMSNDALCGGAPPLHFPPCAVNSVKGSRKKRRLRLVAFILIPTGLTILASSIFFVFLKRKSRSAPQVELALSTLHQRVSYYELQYATNGFSESNLLAAGSSGSVYKGVLRDGTILAIKVFNLNLEGAFKSFDRECEVIRNIRHRNLVKVISSCSNLDFKALVLEYMPNGSLERWLYSHNYFLNFLQRLDIMIDVASALDYLHHGNSSPIVHSDLKPSNVLLDEQMIGHVSDFGSSRLFGEGQNMLQTKTLATIGYIAPEYGSEGIVTTSCDVYSFGILLMETFSRKKPTDEMFSEDWGLKEWVKDALQISATDFIDQNLLTPEDQNLNKMVQCIVSVVELALRCTVDSPGQRTNARDALAELKKSKMLFLSK